MSISTVSVVTGLVVAAIAAGFAIAAENNAPSRNPNMKTQALALAAGAGLVAFILLSSVLTGRTITGIADLFSLAGVQVLAVAGAALALFAAVYGKLRG